MDEFSSNLIKKWSVKHYFNAEQDKYKSRRMLYNSFSKTNSYEFNSETLYPYLYTDVLNRYLKMKGYNVLYTTGLNNLAFSSFAFAKNNNSDYLDLTKNFKNNLDNLGIGYDSNYFLTTANKTILSKIDDFFIKHYNKEIKYVNKEVYTNQALNRYYNNYEIEFSFGKAYSKYTGEELVKTRAKYFVLDISEYESELRDLVNNVDIDSNIKKDFLNTLGDYQNIVIPFYMNKDLSLEIELENPQYMAGISFIALNPSKMDVLPFIASEEYDTVYKYMQNGYSLGMFAGNTLKNPLNYSDICIIISYSFDEAIHVGIPELNAFDKKFAEGFGLEIIPVVVDEHMINSDFLDGLSPNEAREKIIYEYSSEDFGYVVNHFKNLEIIISNPDNTGAPIPFEIIDDGYNYKTLDQKYLPLMFNRFNKVLYGVTPEKNIELVNLTFNNLYQTAILKLFLDDENNYYESHDFINHLTEVICMEEVNTEILFPLIFHLIDKSKIIKKKYMILNDSYPDSDFIVESNNLNINFVTDSLKKYSLDALRLYTLKHSRDKNFEEIFFKINKCEEFINEVIEKYKDGFADSNFDLDNELYKMVNELDMFISSGRISEYAANLEFVFYKTLKNKKWTLDEGLIFLKLLSVVCPFVSEKIFETVYNSYDLLFEEWPNY